MSMDNLILTLVVRWLHASDAIAAVQVSRKWNKALHHSTDNGNLWYQCCLNTNPLATAQIKQQQQQQDSDKVNYRRLALGFIRKVVASCDVSSSRDKLAARALRSAQDVFCVIDLYRNSPVQKEDANGNRLADIEASFVCPLVNGATSLCVQDLHDTVLHGMNPYSAGNASSMNASITTPLKCAIQSFHMGAFPGNELLTKVTLFRRHDLKSICILDSGFAATAYVESPSSRNLYLSCSQVQPLLFVNDDNDEKSSTIHEEHDENEYMSTIVRFRLSPDLPQDEQKWLVDSRNEPDEEALEALSSIPYFFFEMQDVSLTIESTMIVKDDEMTAILNGLCWK